MSVAFKCGSEWQLPQGPAAQDLLGMQAMWRVLAAVLHASWEFPVHLTLRAVVKGQFWGP